MSLFPERHPVRDFFVLDVLDVAPRSDMASMAQGALAQWYAFEAKAEEQALREWCELNPKFLRLN